jgi:putative peptidoglycan lipid II flippase
MVAAGILASRLVGFLRGAAIAHFLGAGGAADAWQAAFRIPNFLQNLFGEGALSASFIPVYAGLLGQGRRDEARRVAGAVAALLGAVVAALVLVGVLATPWLISVIAPGFTGDRQALTITLVRIVFPGTGLLVLSAWCLGILNSHGKFFLSYAAPIAWNVAIIATLIAFGTGSTPGQLSVSAAWASVAGSFLQVVVQLPWVLRLLGGLRLAFARNDPDVSDVVRNFGPAFVARGVTQISAYVDTLIASFLPLGAVANLAYAQMLYTLPVSLFGMSVSAAELPAMSSARGDDAAVHGYLRERLTRGLRQIAFFVVPSAMAFLAIGHVLAALLFQSGRFTAKDSVTVWSILAGSAVGLLAGTLGRLYSSTFYALRDTRTPLRFGVLRVVLTIALGWFAALRLPELIGYDARWGAAGLTVSAGFAAWVEFTLLRRALNSRIGPTGIPAELVARLWASAAVAAACSWAVLRWLPVPGPKLTGVVVAGTFGVAYLFTTLALRVPEARALMGRLQP